MRVGASFRKPAETAARCGLAGISVGVLGLEMLDSHFDPIPSLPQVFGDETAVAMVGLVLAAQ